MADVEVSGFAKAINAVRMDLQPFTLEERRLFIRSNYFQISSARLIIKISRIKRPFWGVGPTKLEAIGRRGPYYLVLLSTGKQGWLLSDDQVAHYITEYHSGRNPPCWSKGTGEDDDYKIYPPLPDTNRFNSPEEFLRKIDH